MNRLIQKFPTLSAGGCYAVAVAVAFWPFWTGQVLFNQFSDQKLGYGLRAFAADYLKRFHDFPGWNPYIFGGMPFLANPTNGDTFYPTFLLRLVLPPDVGITLGILVHIVLAGLFTYLFLRELKLEWGAAFVGGAAYLFTGMVVSLFTAGHDGKIIVSALLPLGLLFLHRGVVRASWQAYLWFGAVVGLCLLSPHVQLTYYALMAAGFFWLFLVTWSGERPQGHRWWHSALWFVAALVVGFALDAIQLLPFLENIPFTPRAGPGSTSSGWAYATSYAMPPEELLNVVWPSFSGMLDHYWGRNPLKLHSEYLGVVPLMLASFSFMLKERRRFAWFFVFLAAYGVLFALGGATPFYRIPYALLPMIKLTRAPGMIFVLVSFSTAVLAAFGTQSLVTRAEQVKLGRLAVWVGVLAAAALLAAAGGWKGVMLSFAPPEHLGTLDANYPRFTLDAVRGAVLAALVSVLVYSLRARRLQRLPWAVAMAFLVLLDLWSGERRQILFSPRASQLFAADGVVKAVGGDHDLFRVLGVAPRAGYLTDNYLMIHRLRSVLGYQGNELHRYDELLGGKNSWTFGQGNMLNLNIWRLLAVKYVVTEQPVQHPALSLLGDGPVTSFEGAPVYVYRYEGHTPYAGIVGEALKARDEQVVATLADQRFDPRRLLLVPPDAPVGVSSLSALPDSVPITVRTTELRPGAYRFDLATALPRPGYLFISENFYPAWKATVDGAPAPVVRAQMSLMAVPVPAGARVAELVFRSGRYRLGRAITMVTLVALLGLAVYGRVSRGRGAPLRG